MGREDRKDRRKGYEGFKLEGDSRKAREARARRNAPDDQMTNEVFAATDAAFALACDQANVKPTKRQASKFRQPAPYGLAARAVGKNARKDPTR